MNKRILVALGVLVVVAAVLAIFMAFPSDDGSDRTSSIEILGNGTIGVNGTLNVKLSSGNGVALKDKTVHVSVKDENGSVVFEDSAQTYVNGVANVKMVNLSAGEYEVNVTFDGDNNYTGSSVVKKLVVAEGVVEEDTDDGADADADDDSSQSQSSSSSSSRSHSRSSNGGGSSSDGGSADDYYDENGERTDPEPSEPSVPDSESE